jgi:hypothetical protein
MRSDGICHKRREDPDERAEVHFDNDQAPGSCTLFPRRVCHPVLHEVHPYWRALSRLLQLAIIPGNSHFANVTYQQQLQRVNEVLKELKMPIIKITHAFQVASARAMDECGIDDKVRRLSIFNWNALRLGFCS